ncbi:MAG: OmpW family outer membrane protein [Candidatus Aminicenantaceae bacterium]
MNVKKIIPIFIVFMLLVFSSVGFADVLKIRVAVDKANVRLKANLSSQTIGQVSSGTVFKVKKKTGDWYLISLPPDENGFVLSGYIHNSVVEEIGAEQEKISETVEEPVEVKREEKTNISPPPHPPERQTQYPPPRHKKSLPKMCFGIKGGYAMLSEAKYSGGITYGASFTFSIMEYVAVEVSGMMFQSDVEGDVSGLSQGSLSSIPIQLSIQGRFPVGEIVPYVSGGAGYFLNSFTLNEELVNNWDSLGFDIEESVDPSFGFHFGAGVDVFFSPNIGLNLDFKYCIASMEGSWKLTDQATSTEVSGTLSDLNLNSMIFTAGLKFCF